MPDRTSAGPIRYGKKVRKGWSFEPTTSQITGGVSYRLYDERGRYVETVSEAELSRMREEGYKKKKLLPGEFPHPTLKEQTEERARLIREIGWEPEPEGDPGARYAATTGELKKWASERGKRLGTLVMHPETGLVYYSPEWWNDPPSGVRGIQAHLWRVVGSAEEKKFRQMFSDYGYPETPGEWVSDQPVPEARVMEVHVTRTGQRSVYDIQFEMDTAERLHVLVPAAFVDAWEEEFERTLVKETLPDALLSLRRLAEETGFDPLDIRLVEKKPVTMEIR